MCGWSVDHTVMFCGIGRAMFEYVHYEVVDRLGDEGDEGDDDEGR